MSSVAKTLFAPSTIALGLLAALGSAQAQQFQQAQPSAAAAAVRKIEVIPGGPVAVAQQAETGVSADASADLRADATDAPADASPNAPQDASPADGGPQTDTAPATTDTAPLKAEPKIITSDAAKRLNRERYIERYEARRYNEPRYNDGYVEPRYVQPRHVEQRYVEPRYYAPRDAYAQRYQAAPNYGHVQRRAEHCAPRGW